MNDLRVTDIRWNLRSIQITWQSAKDELPFESCLYQHSDGSWTIDPDTRKLGARVGEILLKQVMTEFIEHTFPVNDTSGMAQSEVARIEGILRREEMYQKSRKRAASSGSGPKKKNSSRILVWRADQS